MRKVLLLIAACFLCAFALTLWAQSADDLPPIMKDVPGTIQSFNMHLGSGASADAAADAEKLEMLFTKASGVFKALKAQDATDMAMANAKAAGEAMKAAKANDMDAAKAAAGTIQKSCKSCHSVHREQLPDKTYKFK